MSRIRAGVRSEAATRVLVPLLVTVTAGACAAAGSGQPENCEVSPPSSGGRTIEARRLVGRFHLTLVADVDGEPGGMAEGVLDLMETPEELAFMRDREGRQVPDITTPLFGTLRIELEAVGAAAAGDIEADDPEAPGVLVIEDTSGRESAASASNVILRLGSRGNDRRVTPFDDQYAVLFVQDVEGENGGGFSGVWRSGGIQGEQAAGHFCAFRTNSSSSPRQGSPSTP